MMAKLSEEQIQMKLSELQGWTREGDAIQKTYKLPSFPAAIMFVGTVGHLAEAADHHPDILVQWRNVTLTLSTHSAGGLTEKDFQLAAQIDSLPFKK
ncbi:MAG: 4a-hydroxytetrahydrobiopterin dehydratase [Phototrophicales bacterium]|nr:MAG: 4a-hydroxytetrahydrobiopterin dehydratase [Phototrophicales bacterium]